MLVRISFERGNIGFTTQNNETDVMAAVNKVFSPEFRNRLDAVIQFKSLDSKTILSVVNKFIAELEGQLQLRNVILEVDDEARVWLAKNGYDKKHGCPPNGAPDSGTNQKASG